MNQIFKYLGSGLGLPLLLLGLLLLAAVPARADIDGLEVRTRYSEASLAPGQGVDVTVLVTIKAPVVSAKVKRDPVSVSLVLDRSGSMDAARKIDYARMAAKTLVRSLEPGDQFALTIYDDTVDVLYPLGAIRDKEKLLSMIDGIQPRGYTFLSGGLEQGISLLEKARLSGPARVILLSDGLANRGITGGEQVGAIGAMARSKGIGVSSIGLGLDFDEDLMQVLAQRGGGQYYYIADSESLPSVFRDELNLVMNMYTKDMRVTLAPATAVGDAVVYGYVTSGDGAKKHIEMGDLSSDDSRQMLVRLKVTPQETPGRQSLGELSLTYIKQADGKEETVLVPLELEVIADAARREALAQEQAEPVRQVRDEMLLREANESHLMAMQHLSKGNITGARAELRKRQGELAAAAPRNKAAENKLAQLQLDEQNLELAARDIQKQQAMMKSGKAQAYQLAKGKQAGLMLQSGDKGFEVERLQKALAAKGYYAGKTDGIFNAEVEAALRKFQKASSLTVDGVAGPATLNALGLR